MAVKSINMTIGSPRPIAVVDDDSDDLQSLRRELQFLFGETPILTFTSGKDLLLYLQDHMPENERPSLILLDLHMGNIDGIRTLEFLRARPTLADIPVVMISGTHDKRDMLATYRRGAKGFLQKPLFRGDLIRLLHSKTPPQETAF